MNSPFINEPSKHTARWAVVFCTAMLALILWRSPNFGHFSSPSDVSFAGDFMQEWIGGYVVRTEGAAKLYDLPFVKSIQHDERIVGFQWAADSYFAMVYPPFYYLLISPLSLLPYRTAACLFTLLMLGCYFAAIFLLASVPREKSAKRGADSVTTWLFVASLFYVPLIRNITGGQKAALCLLIFTATYVLMKKQRMYWAGVVFGMLVFKPQLALVIGPIMLLRGNWSFVGGALTTVLAATCLSLSLGVDVCWSYVEFCCGVGDYVHIGGYDLHKSHCLLGFLTLLSGGTATFPIKLAALASMGIVFAIAFDLARKSSDSPYEFDLQYAAMVVASLLVSPHLFTYDLTILLLPIYLLGVAYFRGNFPSWFAATTGCLLCALFIAPGFSETIVLTSGLQITTPLMFALVWAIWKQRQGKHSANVIRRIAIDGPR